MSFGSPTQGGKIKNATDNGSTYELHQDLEFSSWENVLETSNSGHQSFYSFPGSFAASRDPFQLPPLPLTQSCAMSTIPGQENELLDQVFADVLSKRQEFGSHSDALVDRQAYHDSLNISNLYGDQMSDENLNLQRNTYYLSLNQLQSYDFATNPVNHVERCDTVGFCDPYVSEQNRQPIQNVLQLQAFKSETDVKPYVEDKTDCPALKPRLLGDLLREGLKMLDSFDSWWSKEQSDVQSIELSSGTFRETVRSEDGDDFGISTQMTLDWHILGPSLSQD
ncbi:hypothetical protein CDL12_15514 [Handroanthus impetiginosus]|uniref:Uncharacterized protein n=1 Tax=Handroanthus impetiginosus TaxID=429701 RepID=A0A2G9H311_9LAMI|nr:hypothetical protein CDL12_15514 [Handroanthus impetiginosus]